MKNKSNSFIIFALGVLCICVLLLFVGSLFIGDNVSSGDVNVINKKASVSNHENLIEEFLNAEDSRDLLLIKAMYCEGNVEYYDMILERDRLLEFYKSVWRKNIFSSNILLSTELVNNSSYKFVTQFKWKSKSGQEGSQIDTLLISFSDDCIYRIKSI